MKRITRILKWPFRTWPRAFAYLKYQDGDARLYHVIMTALSGLPVIALFLVGELEGVVGISFAIIPVLIAHIIPILLFVAKFGWDWNEDEVTKYILSRTDQRHIFVKDDAFHYNSQTDSYQFSLQISRELMTAMANMAVELDCSMGELLVKSNVLMRLHLEAHRANIDNAYRRQDVERYFKHIEGEDT